MARNIFPRNNSSINISFRKPSVINYKIIIITAIVIGIEIAHVGTGEAMPFNVYGKLRICCGQRLEY
jgi:hypothetical protein